MYKVGTKVVYPLHGVGLISINDQDLRVAFSCIEVSEVQELFDIMLQGVQDLTA